MLDDSNYMGLRGSDALTYEKENIDSATVGSILECFLLVTCLYLIYYLYSMIQKKDT